jgi:hypothetical protein
MKLKSGTSLNHGIAIALLFSQLCRASVFEGHINAVTSRGGLQVALLYVVSTNFLRVEMVDTNRPGTVDILDRGSGTVTLVFPQRQCFTRLKAGSDAEFQAVAVEASTPPEAPPTFDAPPRPANVTGAQRMTGFPGRPGLPAGVPPGIGPTNFARPPGFAGMPTRPRMTIAPSMQIAVPGGGLQLQGTGLRTNLLGFSCECYEIKQWGQTMEIWATDQLVPFQDYLPNQPPHVGPPMIERLWSELLAAKGLFPFLAILRFDNGTERYRFEVRSVEPARLTSEEAKGFRTPKGYIELPPRSF